jgi:hypothetical protein
MPPPQTSGAFVKMARSELYKELYGRRNNQTPLSILRTLYVSLIRQLSDLLIDGRNIYADLLGQALDSYIG